MGNSIIRNIHYDFGNFHGLLLDNNSFYYTHNLGRNIFYEFPEPLNFWSYCDLQEIFEYRKKYNECINNVKNN